MINGRMSIPCPTFLSIPPELRQQIYSLCFDELSSREWRNRPAIASVCHQTRSEAFPMVLRERQFFTLGRFWTWTMKGKAELLQEITDVVLRKCTVPALQDAAKESSSSLIHSGHIIVFSQNIDSSEPNFRRTSFTLDEGDQCTFDWQIPPSSSITSTNDMFAITRQIFSSIPNLRHALFHLDSSDHRSFPGQIEFQAVFLRIVATCCPKLSVLNVISDLMNLSDLQGFQNIHSLEWSGMSLSTPQETLAVLNSLPYLHTMKLTHWPYDLHHISRVLIKEAHPHVSFTSYVLQNLEPLRHFQIKHLTAACQSMFLTAPMLGALAAHRETLTHLDLRIDDYVEVAVMDQILGLLPLLSLEQLRLLFYIIAIQYQGIKFGDYITPSVKSCHISMQSTGQEGRETVEHHIGCEYYWIECF